MAQPRISNVLTGVDAPGLTGWDKFHADLARERAADLVTANQLALAKLHARERLQRKKRANLGAKAVEKVRHRVRT